MTNKLPAETEREKQHARANAAEWGNSVPFWIRDGNEKQARRRARHAARWGLKVLGRPHLQGRDVSSIRP